MSKLLLHTVFTFTFVATLAQQNLVPNGSFEIITDCPTGADIFKATGWFSPNYATPDLFHSCADISMNTSTPTNGFGYQVPQDGNGYSGIVTYSYNASQIIYREYLETKLSESLQKDHLYHVRFYTSLADVSPLATNRLGFGFVTDTSLQYLQQVIVPTNFVSNPTILNDSINWIKCESYYLAKGDENYLIIGNFNDDTSTDTLSTGQPFSDVYYLIDNVLVTEVLIAYENVFSPNDDGLNDLAFYNPMLLDFKVDVYNRWGQKINSTTFVQGWNGKDDKGDKVSEGVFFYRAYSSNDNKTIKTGFIQLIR